MLRDLRIRPPLRLVALLVLCAPAGCRAALELAPSDAGVVLSRQLLDAPDPAEPGPRAVRTLYYGSGSDRRRPEYRDSVALRTPTVDASKLVALGDSARERNRYWGFTPREFPLNARVWYPEGDGPFPLVLVAHGNHDMKEFSDPGYAYLGELLASRGYILASVDMNFVNGRIRGENDARGWLFLQHLRQWREWQGTPGNPFHGKVDLDRVALIGHSRGGEAVGHAAAFNRLSRYPDDASLEFDFGFGIRSIVAIAPVDGQYLPADQPVPVKDVNYLVFHGSHDGDVTSFHGLRQYQRLHFSDGFDGFKAAVYVYRANHGQWNTVWGPNDSGKRSGRILDLRGLLEPEEQRRFGKLYISAFLDATLKGDDRYLPIFRDHRVAGGWLPKTMYVTRFQESSFRPLATFEEDIDLTAATARGVRLRGEGLAVWREGALRLRSSNERNGMVSQQAQAVRLGWNRGEGTPAEPAAYTITLPDSLGAAWGLDRRASLDFLLAPLDSVPPPPRQKGEEGKREDRSRPAPGDRDRPKPPMDLSVEITDAAGVSARLPLSRYGAVRRPLEMRVLRRRDKEKERLGQLWELVLQSYSIPLGDFAREAPALDLSRLAKVRFVFDRTPAGLVVLDDVGFSRLDPAFSSVTVGAP